MHTTATAQNTLSQTVIYHNLVDRPFLASFVKFLGDFSYAGLAIGVSMLGVVILGAIKLQFDYLHAGKALCASTYVMTRVELCEAQGRYAHPDCLISVSPAERVYDFKRGICPNWPNPT